MEREALERVLRELFVAEPRGLAAVYLFGSAARGTAGAESDVDLALLYRKDPESSLAGLPLALEAALEARFGRPVEAIVLNTAPVDLVHRVLRDGRLLLDADPSARIRFEVKVRSEYFDLEPVLRRYRRRPGTGA